MHRIPECLVLAPNRPETYQFYIIMIRARPTENPKQTFDRDARTPQFLSLYSSIQIMTVPSTKVAVNYSVETVSENPSNPHHPGFSIEALISKISSLKASLQVTVPIVEAYTSCRREQIRACLLPAIIKSCAFFFNFTLFCYM